MAGGGFIAGKVGRKPGRKPISHGLDGLGGGDARRPPQRAVEIPPRALAAGHQAAAFDLVVGLSVVR